MCGIGGILGARSTEIGRTALERMGARMANRGPDGQRIWLGNGIGLVHRRLKIIDLSEAADCPLLNEDGTIAVLFNGEIYNFRELRDELKACGHTFRSSGDGEVIVHGYEEWGNAVWSRLDGMFAIALWDAGSEQLVLARDRLGEKPLYYARIEGRFYFASNPMVIVEALGRMPEIDLDAIDCFLAHTFIPSRHTIFKAVHVLSPATYMVVGREGERSRERYWHLPENRLERCSVDEAEEKVEGAIVRSVESRLVADVPLGGLLSGGVDSSLVMAIAARKVSGIRTFTMGFETADLDERRHALRVSTHIGSRHSECVMTQMDLLRSLPHLVWEYGQPFGDPAAVATYLVSRMAREHVTVLLSGDGGDEAFGGYWRALSARYAQLYRCLPETLRARVLPGFMSAIDKVGLPGMAARWRRLDQQANSQGESMYTNSQSWFEFRGAILGPALNAGVCQHEPAACFSTLERLDGEPSLVERAMRADYASQLADAFLVKMDVAAMAAKVEARSPLLAPEVVELAWRLPDALKVRLPGETKWLLKKIAAKYVPREVVYRKKQGFGLPLADWFRDRLGNVLLELMADSRSVEWGLINPLAARRVLDEHLGGGANHETRLWTLLWLELWIRICAERELAPTDSLEEIGMRAARTRSLARQ